VTLRTTLALAASLALVTLVGCTTDLGACDDGAAKTVYYQDGVGLPMYGGQALIYASCGRGAYCHTEGARGGVRYGVPFGLDFVMQPDTGATEVHLDEVARLGRAQRSVYDWRENLYERVAGGQMPPGGVAQRQAVDILPVGFHMMGGAGALPAIGTPAAHEILRNWLACGSPVIERTADGVAGGSTIGFSTACEDGTATGCLCPQPHFSSIFEVVIQPQCGSVCHTQDVPTQFMQNHLDMSTRDVAYMNLVGMYPAGPGYPAATIPGQAAGVSCGVEPAPCSPPCAAGMLCANNVCVPTRQRVIPGDPDHSTLVHKLENCDPRQARPGFTAPVRCDLRTVDEFGGPHEPIREGFVCGDVMPLGGPATGLGYDCVIAPIREWIRNGAPND